MRIVSIGDLVTDYYYKEGKLIGVNGGMTSHNIIANIQKIGHSTKVFGVCGNDMAGSISIKSLEDIGVDISDIIRKDLHTRCFHISYFENNDKLSFVSKKRCPFCNNKNWYEESQIDTNMILNLLNNEDILVIDNLNEKNMEIVNKVSNDVMLDLGQYFEFENKSSDEIVGLLSNKFCIIQMNERVEKFLIKKLKIKSFNELFELINPKMLIITRGKKGADFIFSKTNIHKDLISVAKEIDSTGAGDSFFSCIISEYILNNKVISESYIDTAFTKATKLTKKVVGLMGARGHINKLYNINKIKEKCTCEEFEIKSRKKIKRCNININNLEIRVINAVKSNATKRLSKIDFKNIKNPVFIGSGGSYAAAIFASKIINHLYGQNTLSLYPRDFYYRNNKNIDLVFLFSYSGTTNDVITSVKNIDNNKKIIITKGEIEKIVEKTNIPKTNIISYRTNTNKSKERGFLSFEGVLSPSSIFLNYYFNDENKTIDFIRKSCQYWKKNFEIYFKENSKQLNRVLINGMIINIFSGDYSTTAAIDLESKIIESGVFNAIIHEKKNFSHGRFIQYEHNKIKLNIYFKEKETTEYEYKLIEYLNDDTILIESNYSGIEAEFDLLVASQYLIYYISNFINIDLSKPNYSEESMKLYFFKGKL